MKRLAFIGLSVLLLVGIFYYVVTSFVSQSGTESGTSSVEGGQEQAVESGGEAGEQSGGEFGNGQAAPSTDEGTGDDEPAAPPDGGERPPAPGVPAAIAVDGSVVVTSEPEHTAVLVNKQIALPIDYKPDDLVYPDVPFTFDEKVEKRMLREDAAAALKAMFDGAAKDGIKLAGVSGYRSGATQKSLFERYAKRDGEEAANRYSARAGHSEHQTGLAIDVSGIDGKCAVVDCFGDTEEAAWIAEHAHVYGFIVRYPEGKEDITGYKYEPWHLRYVGEDIARQVFESEMTLEEYYGHAAVPVSN